ncbi:MAG: Na(+)-translocating NADH-quinone reductase subunit C [Flavobacteriales bacterium 32-35-8]|nr:MAG: Na(+)-translocating NADH-quinone reductase subunit C [Flavobacteriales bacterium 32-35-8]
MENRTDKNSYTIIFAIVMVLVVGSVLAYAASSLKGKISENQRIEKQQNILYAFGINENDETSANFVAADKVAGEFSKYVTKQLVIQDGNVTEDDQAYLIDVKKEKSNAKDDESKRRLPLFVGDIDGKTMYVVPIYGKGLWDAIWGYVGMDENMVIQGAYFDHKGETPGLGANIKERYFMDDFIGEHLLDESGEFVGITVAKGNADPTNQRKTDNAVDALAGATITGDGVTAMIKSDLRLYAPYFKSLKNN